MMKTIFSILLLSLAAATAAEAQSLEAFKQRLVEPDSGARVEIHEAPDAAADVGRRGPAATGRMPASKPRR